jgi:CHAT domain-containing protein
MGIAGTTVQAGASSAIASLWDLDDQSSVPFIKEFYQHLGEPNISRAEALRLAQQALLKDPNYDHPRFWAPYVLVGSWL